MAPFVELHCHSNFSFLDGASTAEDLVAQAARLGMPALAVTDHQGLYGAIRFAIAADEAGIRPIVGLEIELLDAAVADPRRIVVPERRRARAHGEEASPAARAAGGEPARPLPDRQRLPGQREPVREDLRGIADGERGPHLVLLARDQAGYRSLCRLVSAANLAGSKGVPHFTHELLAIHSEGLVGLSGCRQGEISRRLLCGDDEGAAAAARRLASLFEPLPGVAERGFFLELQHHLLPEDDRLVAATVELAERSGLPVVTTNDTHYALPEDRELQDVLVCIRHGMSLDESAHLRRANGEYHLKGEAELLRLPPTEPETDERVGRAWREGIRRAGEIAERCTIDVDFDRYRFPGFRVPEGETSFSYLVQLCQEGARQRYHPLTSAVVKQLAHELDVIERTGLAEFFLICWDLMRFSREHRIPAQGRGSAGDSIVAYVLGITRVDPIRHGLLFERFINEGRTAYPDVDIDFSAARREEVIQYVYERYGEAHTGMVCNVVTYRARSAVREVGYALGFPRPLVDRVAKALETYDSVMVRRDLETEGGFGEFFQVPSPTEPLAGSSPVAGGNLPEAVSATVGGEAGLAILPSQAIPAARTSEAARDAAHLARREGFVDPMGQLNHGRGGRIATAGADEHRTGRLARPEDVDRTEGHPARQERLLPVRGESDEGGPGDSPVSIAWLRAERATRLRGSSPPDGEGSPGDSAASMVWLREEQGIRSRFAAAGESDAQGSAATSNASARRASTAAGELVTGRGQPGRRDGDPLGALPGLASVGPDPGIENASRTSDRKRLLAPADKDDYRPPALRAEERGSAPDGRGLAPDGRGSAPDGRGSAPDGRGSAERDRRYANDSSVARIEPLPGPLSRPGSTARLSPWERWLELCARIDGFPRHLSIHSGGMLVTRAPLVDIAPLERATMPDRVVVQYDKRDVETIKLIKLDLLGLRMLSAIDDAIRDIAVDCGVHVDLDRLPEDLPEVFRMIQAADTVGVFQIESRAQMQTLPRSRPKNLDDLVVEVAIIRPGPIQGNAVHPYLRRKQGLEPVRYLHPSLEPILAETLGVILYQEQVMRIAIDVAGFSPAESDGFRRAMGTWRSTREMEKLHARFSEGCRRQNGLTEAEAEELFRQVAGFASFGFNKSHAAAFARTAYESAFLKLYYPAQLTAGLINAQPMGFYPAEVLINDAKRHGVAVLPVDVDRSRYRTATEWVGLPGTPLPEGSGIEHRPAVVRSSACLVPNAESRRRLAAENARGYGIRLGLHLVKGIGEEHAEALDAERQRGPYRSLADVVSRTGLSEEVVERLIRAGALDSLGSPRRSLLWQLREVAGSSRGRVGRAGRERAAGRPLDLRLPPTPAPDLPAPTELERLGDSYAILSLDARRQVVELFRPALDRLGAVPVARLADLQPGSVAIGGLVVTRQHPMTARGTVFLALEDETGMVNVTLWPDTWARLRGVIRRHALLFVRGGLERQHSVVNLIARDVRALTEVARGRGAPGLPVGVRQLGQAGMRRLG
ncbi:MAG TPA: PHP domain-containing protein [Candidatus Limnocylindrales bacterium]|nr:PHP domain-containing protein [Candidatus Limnocylindrales bacterium]